MESYERGKCSSFWWGRSQAQYLNMPYKGHGSRSSSSMKLAFFDQLE